MAANYTPYPRNEKGIELLLAKAIEETQEDLDVGKNPLVLYTPSSNDLDESEDNAPDNNDPGSDHSPPSRKPR
jgi:hypothetical protein